MRKFALTAALILSTIAARAEKVPVSVDCQSDDNVGTRFCSDLRDVIAESPRYRLTSDMSQFHLNISVVTVRVDDSTDYVSAVSLVFLLEGKDGNEIYMNHAVQVTGGNKTRPQASAALADLDHSWNAMIDAWSKKN